MSITVADHFQTYTEGWFDVDSNLPDSIAVYSSGWWEGLDIIPVFFPSASDGRCIEDHEALAIARFIEQYKTKPNLNALLKSLGTEQVQDIEDALCAFYDRLNIDLMVGAQLDGIGQIVGIVRDGKNDEVYRIYIKVKIGANNSQSSIENIITVWKILNGNELVQITEIYPASLQIGSDFLIQPPFDSLIKELLEDVIAAGVRLEGILVFDPDNAFAFDEPINNLNTGGFGDLLVPGIGGLFAGYV